LGSNLSSTTAHTHLDTFENDAYTTAKPGIGQRIKNAFSKVTHHGKNKEVIKEEYIGPNGEKIKEKDKFK